MEYQDWYTRYQAQNKTTVQNNGAGGPGAPQPNKKKQRRSVGVGALIACMLATALLGGVGGGYLMKAYADGQAAEISQQQQAAIDSAVQAAMTSASAAASTDTLSTGTSMNAAGGTAYSKAQVIELCASSVVGIDVTYPVSGYSYWGSSSASEGSGSGIVVTSDGYIVTCLHVVESASDIKVVLNDDTEHAATLVGSDSRNDLAVIKIEETGLTPCTLGDSDMLTVGDEVIAIGNPLGELRGTATSGIVSALNRDVSVEDMEMTLIQTDAAISPGNSGGGLFNSNGTLIGIVNAKASSEDSEGLGFAIPVNSVKQVISDLMVHGYVTGRAYLGVYTQNVTMNAEQNGWGGGSFFGNVYGSYGTACVQVAQVVEGSAAQTAGIEVNDLILAVDDQEISSNDDLSSVIGEYNAGDSATIKLQRDGKEWTVNVVFGEYAPTN